MEKPAEGSFHFARAMGCPRVGFLLLTPGASHWIIGKVLWAVQYSHPSLKEWRWSLSYRVNTVCWRHSRVPSWTSCHPDCALVNSNNSNIISLFYSSIYIYIFFYKIKIWIEVKIHTINSEWFFSEVIRTSCETWIISVRSILCD